VRPNLSVFSRTRIISRAVHSDQASRIECGQRSNDRSNRVP
jgi:hypothetical protein